MGTPAQEWMQQGRTEGRAEGEAKAKAESILIALETRFGPLDGVLEAKIRRTAPEDFDALFRRALTAPSLEAVFDDRRH